MRKWPMLCLLGSVALCSPVSTWAEEAADTHKQQQQLTEVKRRIQSLRRSMNTLREEKNSLNGLLRTLERRQGDIARRVQQIESKAGAHRRRLAEIGAQQRQLHSQMNRENQALAGQMRSAYAIGRQEKLKLILNQLDVARISRVWAYYDYFNQARLSSLKAYQADYAQLQTLERELAHQSERLEAALVEKRHQRSELEQNKASRRQVLAKLDRELSTKASHLNRLKRNQKRLQELVESIHETLDDVPMQAGLTTPFPKQRGHLFWPVKGKLLHAFGSKRAAGRWEGVLIGANEGTPVRVISRGRVAFSDWLRGYGLLAIVDHGDGYMTLYAFNQSLNKSVGDWVNAGDIIATVGKSGGRQDSGLYFEVRKKGKPVNPLNWLRKLNRA